MIRFSEAYQIASGVPTLYDRVYNQWSTTGLDRGLELWNGVTEEVQVRLGIEVPAWGYATDLLSVTPSKYL